MSTQLAGGDGNPTSYSFESLSFRHQWHNNTYNIGLNFHQSQPGIGIVSLSFCLSHSVKYVTAKDVPYTTHKNKPLQLAEPDIKTTIILLYSPHISPNYIKLNTLSLSPLVLVNIFFLCFFKISPFSCMDLLSV